MNVEDTLRRVAKELSELEGWTGEKRKWADWWEERVRRSFGYVHRALPDANGDGLRLKTRLGEAIPEIGSFVERLREPFLTKTIMFKSLRERLAENQAAARVPPSRHSGTPSQIITAYLRSTPLREIFDAEVDVVIPEERRFEHTWFLAGTGSGKTTAFRWMVLEDLKRVARGEASVVIMEPKGDLLELARHAMFRDQPERLAIIDPRDPISINPFDHGRDDDETFSMSLDLVQYLVEGLFEGKFTPNHATAFSYAFELAWRIPNATIYTLIDVLERGLTDDNRKYLAAIPDWEPRKFLRDHFDFSQRRRSDEPSNYRARAQETSQRLNNVVRTREFRSLLRQPKSTFDLFTAINEGKLILINANKNIMGSRVRDYGRFFLALIDRAAKMRREYMRGQHKIPVFAYIDEAHDFIKDDPKTEEILSQARDQRIALLLSHQDASQVKSIMSTVFTNTTTKIVSRPEVEISRLTESMHADRAMLASLPQHHFAVAVRHEFSAVSVKFPLAEIERMSDDEFEVVRAKVRDRYTYMPDEPVREAAESPPEPFRSASDEPPEPPPEPPRRGPRRMGTA